MTDPFKFDSYKAFLQAALLDDAPRGSFSRAATAIGCQSSYLSRVIKAEHHLTLDQAYSLTGYLKMNAREAAYFRQLVEYERAGDQEYRKYLEAQLSAKRRDYESLSSKAQKVPSKDAYDAQYFSSWHYSAIHFLTSVPGFQSPEALAKRLGLGIDITKAALKTLEKMEYIKKRGSGYEYARGDFHLPKGDPLLMMFQQVWRSKATLDSMVNRDESLHYTNIQTLSETDFNRLRLLILDFIAEVHQVAEPSKPETGFALTLDFFRV